MKQNRWSSILQHLFVRAKLHAICLNAQENNTHIFWWGNPLLPLHSCIQSFSYTWYNGYTVLPIETLFGAFSIYHTNVAPRSHGMTYCYWNMLLTESSRWACQIISATSFGIDERTVCRGKHLCSGSRMEFITIISSSERHVA